MRPGFALAITVLLAGCATSPGPRQESEERRLARECRERGGIFVPLPGRMTGYPAADNACEYRGGAAPLRPNAEPAGPDGRSRRPGA